MVDTMKPWINHERVISVKKDANRGRITIDELCELVCISVESANVANKAIEKMMRGGK